MSPCYRSNPACCVPAAVHVPLSQLHDLWPAATGSAGLRQHTSRWDRPWSPRDQAPFSGLRALWVRACSFGEYEEHIWLLYIHAKLSLLLLSVSFSSLQVEVIVSLVPLVANSNTQKVVLILSSSVPVNWAITAHGVRGHISVHVRAASLFAFPDTDERICCWICHLIDVSNNSWRVVF